MRPPPDGPGRRTRSGPASHDRSEPRYEIRPGETGIRLTQSVLVTAGMSVIVVTMLVHPVGRGGRRLRLWLDAATALTAVAAFLWYFSVAVDVTGRAADRYVTAAGAAVMLVIAFGVVKLILSGTAPFTLAGR